MASTFEQTSYTRPNVATVASAVGVGSIIGVLVIGIPVMIAAGRLFGFNSDIFWIMLAGLGFYWLVRK